MSQYLSKKMFLKSQIVCQRKKVNRMEEKDYEELLDKLRKYTKKHHDTEYNKKFSEVVRKYRTFTDLDIYFDNHPELELSDFRQVVCAYFIQIAVIENNDTFDEMLHELNDIVDITKKALIVCDKINNGVE